MDPELLNKFINKSICLFMSSGAQFSGILKSISNLIEIDSTLGIYYVKIEDIVGFIIYKEYK